MIKFIHLSDLHIHGSNMKEDNVNTIKIIDYIIGRYADYNKEEKPVVLITGDITDDGKKNQYKNAVKILGPLVNERFEVLACPGNHDYGPAGNIYTEKSQQLFQDYILGELLNIKKAGDSSVTMEDLYPMQKSSEEVLFIGLDSVVG
ncbi:MAG: metallophosphoesterase, partial [Deltaproteobacteria bacterium]|nr:metallophosphoesterase [Deltaproteobacteria bacterium]